MSSFSSEWVALVSEGLRTAPASLDLPDGRSLMLRTGFGGKRWTEYLGRLADGLALLFRPPRSLFPVEASGKRGLTSGTLLRWDQVASARAWGIVFEGCEERAFRIACDELALLARSAAQILQLNPRYNPSWLPGLVAEPLERLIADVLNEHEIVAQRARLAEDFIEKTDLRVRYSDLQRARGARVQISWSLTEEAAHTKAEGIKRAEEYVIVSPWTLSEPSPAQAGEGRVRVASVRAKESEEEARQWTRAFDQAIRHAHESPQGALAALPEARRELVRTYVHQQAFETTARLRRRQQ